MNKKLIISEILKQATWWDYFSRIVPLLFVIVSASFFFNHYTNLELLVWVGIIMFAVTSLIWWWWTLYNIYRLTKILDDSYENFVSVVEELSNLKDSLDENSPNNRQRRKSSKN